MTDDVLVVDVTAEDIAKGEWFRPTRCPLALAFNRANKRTTWAVGAQFVTSKGGHVQYTAPELKGFVRRFDSGKPVEPRTFRFRRRK